jgi:transcriptional regulator GlxA family with amidase domain
VPSVAFVVSDGFHAMALAAQPVFAFANVKIGDSFYETVTLSEHGKPVSPMGGPIVITEPFGERTFDTVIFAGGDPKLAAPSSGVLAYARRSAETSRRIASICNDTLGLCVRFAHAFSARAGGRGPDLCR